MNDGTTGSGSTAPTVTGISDSPATGDLGAGKTVTLTLGFSSAVTVAGGKPTLTLNDGGTATYASGSGTSALTFTYAVAGGQNTPDLMVTTVNLPTGVTITSGGAAANLSLGSVTQSSPQIDTAAPAAPAISSDTVSGNIVTLKGTAEANSTVTVFDNSTKLGAATTNSSGAWTYATGALANGSQSFTATATDGAANVSPASSALAVTLTGGTPSPTIIKVSDSPATGDLGAGKTVTLTLGFSSAVTVAGGAPTLTLSDGGTATYASGSGTTALTFTYTVAAGQNAASLAATAVNLPSGMTIKNSAGAAASLSLSGLTQSGPQIDTTAPAAPAISSDTVSGNIVTLKGTAEANSTVTVFDNSTKLGAATTNSSGAWTYATGALANGSQSFTATATDGAANVSPASSALVVTLAGSSGSSGNLVTNGSFETGSLSGWTLGGNSTSTTYGPEIFIDRNPESGTYAAGMGSVGSDGTLSQTIATTAGKTYTLSFWLQNDAPGANDFKALWNGQTLLSFTNAANFGYKQYTYTVTATTSSSTLQFSARNDPSQWDFDNISLTANGSSAQVDTIAPTVISLVASPATANLNAGKTVALTLAFSENVTVAGRPTLKLNDGGTATYVSGSGTKALTFNYTVAAGQSTASLAATAVSLASGVTIKDSAGNAANLSLAGRTQSGPQIDTATPTVTSLIASPAKGDLSAGKTVALTLAFSEPVTVAGRLDASLK